MFASTSYVARPGLLDLCFLPCLRKGKGIEEGKSMQKEGKGDVDKYYSHAETAKNKSSVQVKNTHHY